MSHKYSKSIPADLSRDEFVEVFGPVYEHSPWIAQEAWDGGLNEAHNEAEALHKTLAAIVDASGEAAQLALLRAHPDLAGKLAVQGDLTVQSSSEQAGAGLDLCTAEEFAEFQDLNDRYKSGFGFPYILAVSGRGRVEILDDFRSRINNSPDVEFAEALKQVHRIALIRLNQID
ncbi:MAG: 2-oxo-4-hydroxy-4-carboxy-5-ureidoimidazoline decarboxylase [Alphaproteobacteria bacterium]|jgi:2-oxo-4-hydroxy-4-carboxy-5-ureidoimidazoline decarboxylase|nr:2-oxo-4-hydroxy-4-carboxy-5-ureidoimidazoline decarboxylase [Alphaproteobacteria bacterium]MBT4017150.1 2-oxo-4-hydroxy-4-carboxy-5-ureidoimidazoline decarboxylase [Alphaproteobacteria bacterium]MBT4966236.1 2-oxo-4-hydroxy-4-carboxy-5-ureidoimidazoline decarboxylase [Alphaproteobacteria bacterium]MBT5159201.1 2-oxo-4-hydroxy-4-carboxy-5-ureidoimidazoline decarboxylase [Alphaproteobacteria bacterium]MBT5918344.1 2-oxo-4-hydroxy-4-carboxy-5-ureidoimidazoline decarboxylase [Alphaproteobacteria